MIHARASPDGCGRGRGRMRRGGALIVVSIKNNNWRGLASSRIALYHTISENEHVFKPFAPLNLERGTKLMKPGIPTNNKKIGFVKFLWVKFK